MTNRRIASGFIAWRSKRAGTLSGSKCRGCSPAVNWFAKQGGGSIAVAATAKAPACTLCGGARYAHRHGARRRTVGRAGRSRRPAPIYAGRLGTSSPVRRRGTRPPGRAAPPDRRSNGYRPRWRDRRREPHSATAQLPMVRSPRRRRSRLCEAGRARRHQYRTGRARRHGRIIAANSANTGGGGAVAGDAPKPPCTGSSTRWRRAPRS